MESRRVAIFLGGYLPAKRYGGPVTSISNLVDNIGDKVEFYIISNDHDFDDYNRLPGIKEGWNQIGYARVLYLKEKEFTVSRFIEILKEIQPRCIYLSSIFYYKMNFPAIKAARYLNIHIVWATRGELSPKALEIGSWKKKPYLYILKKIGYFKNIRFQATSQEEFENIKKLLCPEDVVLLSNMPPIPQHKSVIVKEKGKLKVLTISRIVSNKNTLYSIKVVKKLKSIVDFDIYGPIEDQEYWEHCKREMNDVPENVKIHYKGILDPEEAKSIYLNYDCLLLPTKFENYGQVIAEALMHDCIPVISIGTTPWGDINQAEAGFALMLGDDMSYIDALENISSMDSNSYEKVIQNVRKYVKNKINCNSYKEEYLNIFN